MTMQQHGRSTGFSTLARALLALGTASVALLGVAGTADAAGPSPITDYANYPAPLPAGCPDGAGALTGLSYSNGRGGTASSLWGLNVRHGDTVTKSWSGFDSDCLAADGSPAITVGLAAYDNPTLRFDPTVDEELLDGWAACGAEAGACTKVNNRYQLQVTLPGSAVCNLQLDSFLGLPLAIIGPSGSFYSDASRGHGPNRLLSASNFGLEPCVAPTTTQAPTTTAAPQVPEAPVATAPETTVAPPEAPTTTAAPLQPPLEELPEATTTTAPTPVTAPSVSAPATTTTTTAAIQPPVATTSTTIEVKVLNATAEAPAQGLPFTGSNTFQMLRYAAWLTLAGGMALTVAAALRRRHNAS